MTFRQLNLDIVHGKAGKKVLWQPRIGCWKTDKELAGTPLPAPYTGMTLLQIYDSLNCSPRPYDPYNSCVKVRFGGNITFETINKGEEVITVTHTPKGDLTSIEKKCSAGYYHSKYNVVTPEDIEVQAYVAKNMETYFDMEEYKKCEEEIGNRAAPSIFIQRIPIQRCFIDYMGVENTTYALIDYPEKMESLFNVINENDEQMIEVLNNCPIEIINFGDNVHSGTLPPRLFEKYALPVYQHRSKLFKKGKKFIYAHWDGDTKPILKYAHATGMDGIEAITPLPQGDVTLEEIKAGLGDDMVFLDGIPAVYFNETFPVSILEECTHRLIELFAGKLILGISDEISSTGDLERIKIVGKIVDEHNKKN